MIRPVFAIRNKRSGAFMPPMKRNRGYTQVSYWPPTAFPRLFASERAAKNALTLYIKGAHYVYRYGDELECDEHWVVGKVKPMGRHRDDYEVVPMELRYD